MRNKVKIADANVEFEVELIEVLSNFASMWNGYFDGINIAKQPFKSSLANEKPTHSAPYQAGPKTRESERVESKKMVLKGVTQPAQTEWKALIVLAVKK